MATPGVLIDDLPGTRTPVSPPPSSCGSVAEFVAIGGPWAMFRCVDAIGESRAVELYSLARGGWTSVDYSAQVARLCDDDMPGTCELVPVAVGADWLELAIEIPWGDCTPECVAGYGFLNIRSGAWRQTDPFPVAQQHAPIRSASLPGLSATRMLDLDSPSLSEPVCRPLRLPDEGRLVPARAPGNFEDPSGGGIGVSPVKFYGTVGLVGNFGSWFTPPLYLQRCGSPKRVPVSGSAATSTNSSKLIVWDALKGQLDGRFLSDERPLIDRLPHALAETPATFDVGPRHLYEIGVSGRIWESRLPREPHKR
jgi:hypothetical protein